MPRYLTKSRFKLALECPSKLYYTGKDSYANTKVEDKFLEALAEGGFQVGELAKLYYEGGHNIDELGHAEALEITAALLGQVQSTIYEAAFKFENLFVRADIVQKTGAQLDLIEVKAKSFDPVGDSFTNNKGQLTTKWKPYLFDVAFQYHVITKAYPTLTVTPYLLLADKTARASVDGLNQLFRLEKKDGRTVAVVREGVTRDALGAQILVRREVTDIVMSILNGEQSDQPFEEMVRAYSENYENDTFLAPTLGSKCGKCEFRANAGHFANGLRSGFHECWSKKAGFANSDFDRPGILSLWDFRKKDEYITGGKYFLADLDRSDLEPKSTKKAPPGAPGLSRVDRQELQIKRAKDNDNSQHVETAALKNAMRGGVYPLHFIDFETTSVAIPFNKGRRPYEQTAFQFSHHIIENDGTVRHAGQWINTEPGVFPNFAFVRELRKQLETDGGSVFRYAAHENTILNAVYEQLQQSDEPDKDLLCPWIKTVTKSKAGGAEAWEGPRNMIDLREWVLRYYFNPLTDGSNSIKDVLPAMLRSSSFLREKYGRPVYGTEIQSLNFTGHQWVTFDETGRPVNPYHTLPRIHEGWDNGQLDELCMDEEAGIFDGGAAMTAYAKMQFTEMTGQERERITAALLRYCELDTLAMVMLWEGWKEFCK